MPEIYVGREDEGAEIARKAIARVKDTPIGGTIVAANPNMEAIYILVKEMLGRTDLHVVLRPSAY